MSSRLNYRREVPARVRVTLELRQGATAQPRPGKRRSDARGARNGARASLRKLV